MNSKEQKEGIMLNLIIFGIEEEYLTFFSYAKKQKKLHCKHTDVYDTFLSYLSDDALQAVFILMDGAIGMEGVIAAKNLHPHIPVVWISNDKGFGIQSYRLGCVFFSDKPLTENKIITALARIEQNLFDDKSAPENRFSHLDDLTLQKIKHAQNANELIAKAKKYGIMITKEEADNYFRYLAEIQYGEMDDDMLEQISAGNDIRQFKLFFDSTQELWIELISFYYSLCSIKEQ